MPKYDLLQNISAKRVLNKNEVPDEFFKENLPVLNIKSIDNFLKDKFFKLFIFYKDTDFLGIGGYHSNYNSKYFDKNDKLISFNGIYLLGGYITKKYRHKKYGGLMLDFMLAKAILETNSTKNIFLASIGNYNTKFEPKEDLKGLLSAYIKRGFKIIGYSIIHKGLVLCLNPKKYNPKYIFRNKTFETNNLK